MSNAESISPALAANQAVTSKAALSRVLVVVLLVFIPFVAFWPSTAALAVRWADTVHRTYTHGYLVLALVAWMLWRERRSMLRITARPSWAAMVLLACLGFVWLVFFRAGIQIAHQVLLPIISGVAVLACYGASMARRVAFPVGYLYFAIPVWDATNSLLQSVSVYAVRQLLQLAGVPAYFTGNTFQIPAGAFEIADGCSGLHFMVVALSIGALYGEVNRDSWRNRLILIALAGGLAALTNWLRIFVIVMAGHLTDMQHYLIKGEHYNFGWMMFAGMMVLFLVLARRMPVTDEGATATSVPQEIVGTRAAMTTVSIVIAAMLAAPVWAYVDSQSAPAAAAQALLPEQNEKWQRSVPAATRWRPQFAGADEQGWADFKREERSVEVYAARYREQAQGKELMGYENSSLGEGLRAVSGSTRAPHPQWSERVVRDQSERQWLLWSAYLIDGSWFTSGLKAQLVYGMRSLVVSPASTAMLLRAACEPDCDAARELLEEFSDSAVFRSAEVSGRSSEVAQQSGRE